MLSRVEPTLPKDTEEIIHRVIGCALAVHSALGPGYAETVYHRALKLELRAQLLKFDTEYPVDVRYRDQVLYRHRLDLLIERQLIVEIKAVTRLEVVHQCQVVSYLRASGLRAGLLINFNTPALRWGIRRVVL
jgi:GxxExxY protein